jgi:hypothetical protein
MHISMKEIVKKILEKIENNENDTILLDSPVIPGFEINQVNFSEIKKINSEKKIAFVDGGNLEILKSPSISLFFNRVYYAVYQNNKRCDNKLFEFFSLISAKGRESRITFKTECFFTRNNLQLKDYSFDSFDPSLIKGGKRADISLVGDALRRLSEFSVINEI